MRTGWVALVTGLLVSIPAQSQAQARIEKNVVVGMYSGLALLMDVHRPERPNGYGIVHIAGSGWSRPLGYNADLLSQNQLNGYVTRLVADGYTVFTLNHRATPRFQFPGPLEDVQRAVRFVRYNARDYGISPERIGAVGGSSGGHLVLMLGMLDGQGEPSDPDPVNRVSAKVQTVVARAAPADLGRIDTEVKTRLALLMGAVPSQDAKSIDGRLYWNASPINFITSDDPPVLLLHGDADENVPFEQAGLMSESLKAVGVASAVIRVPGGGHGPEFPGATNAPDYLGGMIDWFNRYLKK